MRGHLLEQGQLTNDYTTHSAIINCQQTHREDLIYTQRNADGLNPV